jgi:hypothetical protein
MAESGDRLRGHPITRLVAQFSSKWVNYAAKAGAVIAVSSSIERPASLGQIKSDTPELEQQTKLTLMRYGVLGLRLHFPLRVSPLQRLLQRKSNAAIS